MCGDEVVGDLQELVPKVGRVFEGLTQSKDIGLEIGAGEDDDGLGGRFRVGFRV